LLHFPDESWNQSDDVQEDVHRNETSDWDVLLDGNVDDDLDELDDENQEIQAEATELPASLEALQKQLLDGYTCPTAPPASVGPPRLLTQSELYSLKHYIAWAKSNGTVEAYKLHAQNLQDASGVKILALFSVRKLGVSLSNLEPLRVDICPQSCIAYTGEFERMPSCPYIHSIRGLCGQPRYHPKARPSARDKPRAQMLSLAVMATIRAMFANVETSQLLRHRDRCLQDALHLMATASTPRTFSDFGDSDGLTLIMSTS
jgi:hypothetical protein